jgi:hypothetical protein
VYNFIGFGITIILILPIIKVLLIKEKKTKLKPMLLKSEYPITAMLKDIETYAISVHNTMSYFIA